MEPCDHGLECEADILPKSRLRGGSSTCDWADIAARRKAPLSRCASQTQSDRLLVEDNGPIHVSKIALAALDARKHWLTIEWLPKYAPELNDIEVVWRDLKAHHLAHQTFTDAEALDREIHAAVEALNRERNVDSLVNWRISA